MSVSIKKRLTELVKNNSLFHTEKVHEPKLEDLDFENGMIMLASDRSKKISYAEVLKDAGLPKIELSELSERNPMANHSAYSYAVHFVKVKVHPTLGTVKVIRAVSAIDAGKIINEKTAESQVIGYEVGGISM